MSGRGPGGAGGGTPITQVGGEIVVAVTLSDVWGNAVALTADLTATQLVGARSGHVIHLTDMRLEPAPGGIGMLLHMGTTVGCDSKSSSPCLCFQRATHGQALFYRRTNCHHIFDTSPSANRRLTMTSIQPQRREECVQGSRLAPSLRGQAPDPSRVRANGASDAGG